VPTISTSICQDISLHPIVSGTARVLFVCVWWCPIHMVLCFCFVCHRLNVVSFSELSMFDCPLGVPCRLFTLSIL